MEFYFQWSAIRFFFTPYAILLAFTDDTEKKQLTSVEVILHSDMDLLMLYFDWTVTLQWKSLHIS